ncbi:MAG: response regulator transcription factor [Acidimicrobiia bacterium]|nr:response regulator transcription factor [Acidimicrobiia bacterium]MBT8192111.1 response regulator transcription factor [Acidimicrobiia bacterium]MBT8246855.1 response regulator transcription factor [Acidimicrobiia bacterium]NNF87323.1 response regulator transcription factor [Acidimicrobiia bacterium]NNL14205.1 response regulator transcription factor [Acidimicrobiia bacterium]
MRTQRVLVVDDEPNILQLVGAYLTAEGYDVFTAADGETALDVAERTQPDLVVLDVMLPGIDGVEVLRRLRTKSDVYVIMLTARAEETDKLIGLSVGADDYITKPFSPREFVARAKAVLRRNRLRDETETDGQHRFEHLTIDATRREVTCDDSFVELSALEFDLLAALAAAPGRVFSRRQLLERVWGWDFFGDERVVDAHIRHIRKLLHDDAGNPRFIGTVRGVGYKFVAERQ